MMLICAAAFSFCASFGAVGCAENTSCPAGCTCEKCMAKTAAHPDGCTCPKCAKA